MVCAYQHAGAGVRAGRYQVFLAADRFPMAYRVGGMDANFDPAEIARCAMAQTFVPVSRGNFAPAG